MLDRMFTLGGHARNVVLGVTITAVLLIINVEIVSKEHIIKNGTTVLLRIAPRDPRSLLQGDYMALRYSLAEEVATEAEKLDRNDGIAVIEVDQFNEAFFVSLYTGQPLQNRQHLLRYRKRGESVRLASDAYFFEEGTGSKYNIARFGEIRVNTDGEAVLIGLLDASYKRLGPAMH